jgi:hypothetical protein
LAVHFFRQLAKSDLTAVEGIKLNFVFFDAWETLVDGVLYGATAKPGNYFAILCDDSAVINPTTAIADIVAQELSGDGYTREAVTFQAPSTAGGRRVRLLDNLTWQFTSSKSYRYLVILGNANSTVGNTTGTPMLLGTAPAPVTVPPSTDRTFQITLNTGS